MIPVPWWKITFFGDTVVLLPAALTIAVWLAIGRAWRMAAIWCVLFSVGLTLVAATKIAFVGWGIGIRSLDFTGFSGHAMRATAVIPAMLYLILQRTPRTVRITGVMFGFAVGALISFSRVVVHAHSVSEMVLGAMLGALISIWFIRASTDIPNSPPNRWLIAFSLAGVFGTSHAQPAPTQHWINGVALYLSGHDKPYDRESWRAGSLAKNGLRKYCSTDRRPGGASRSAVFGQKSLDFFPRRDAGSAAGPRAFQGGHRA
ncbi:MAG TPA: phosphatase PAP2 family protein [Burkholderiaceae bacterium]|jgi:membrane-associated phospholipid phosphatase|nr:phosphatase PAP2 family protein [Burkholderiaceae bacterium]